MGDTSFLLNALVLNVGDYVNRFMGMTLNSFAFDRPVEWMNNWTLFFWAWWVAWSPFVGLFLARISRGRTIRQFVMGTLIIPFTFTLLCCRCSATARCMRSSTATRPLPRRRCSTGARLLQPAGAVSGVYL